MKIYTKSGDAGQTSLLGGQRVSKSNPRIELLGTLDELNSVLGLALSVSTGDAVRELLERTQRQLFDVGAELATSDLSQSSLRESVAGWTNLLEREIDRFTEQLPRLVHFILPGGTTSAASLHLARAVCRRVERVFFAESIPGGEWVGVYLNRLGDWLFVLARWANHQEGFSESEWSRERR